MRILAVILAIGGVLGAAVPTAVAAPSQSVRSDGEIFAQLQAAIREGRSEDTLALAQRVQTSAAFSQYPADLQEAIYSLIGALSLDAGQLEQAAAALEHATSYPSAGSETWFNRMNALSGLNRRNDTALVLIEALQRSTEVRDQLDEMFVLLLARDSEISDEVSDEVRYRLRVALFESGWRGDIDDGLWMDLIDDYLDRDDMAHAISLVAEIRAPYAVVRLYGLRRYDQLRSMAGAPALDMATVVSSDIAQLRARAEGADPSADGRADLAFALLRAGHYQDALAVTDSIIATLTEDDASDLWRNISWAYDTRSRALMALGSHDDALAAQQTAAGRIESGSRNISQAINLGWLYVRLGRPQDALNMVAHLDSGDDISAFGKMQAVQVRACAAQALGDSDLVATSMAYLRTNWHDAPDAYAGALACVGDEDALASLTLTRLEDPDLMAAAVEDLHNYRPFPDPTEFDARITAAHQRVAARPEVIAARDAVGRELDMPILGPQF